MTAIDVRAGMDLPSLPASHKLQPVLRSALGAPRSTESAPTTHGHWEAAFFGLDRSRVFRQAREEEQARIVDEAGRALLEEAYFIEKSGISFAAKMVLLADSIEERALYALFAADEATHFSAIRRFLIDEREAPGQNPFFALLSSLIEEGERATLQFVVQIVLEGWGLRHYRHLRDACTNLELRGVFDAILADEAAHHGSGRVLYGERPAGGASARAIVDTLRPLLGMVQVGPRSVMDAVERVLGHLSRRERATLFEELGGEGHAAARLTYLRDLMQRSEGASDIVATLDACDAFRPLSYEDCS